MEEATRGISKPTTIALLGGTGKTGREVLRELLRRKDVEINVYVRSASKLATIFPNLSSDRQVSIYEGPLGDTENMCNCLRAAQTIIFALGENDNIPGVTVIDDGAKVVLEALDTLRQQQQAWSPVRLLLLSSATWNPVAAAKQPSIIHWAIKTAFFYPYQDLRRGTARLMEHPSLVKVVEVQPNGLIEDQPSGHYFSPDHASLSVTYSDLGAAFVDLACSHDYDSLAAALVSGKDGDDVFKYGPELGYRIIRGLVSYFPGFWTLSRFMTRLGSSVALRKRD